MRDEALNVIAVHEPKRMEDLRGLRSVRPEQLGEKRAHELLDVVAAALALPDSEYPKLGQRNSPLGKIGPACDLLKVLLIRL